MAVPGAGRGGPVLNETVDEVQGVFATDAALQDAIGRLTLAGFDRSEISVPDPEPLPGESTPEQGASNPNTEDDQRQVRTMTGSLAAAAGAMAAAGAVVATGGAALPAVAAAVAGGGLAGGAATAASSAANQGEHRERAARAMNGTLVLSARTRDAARREAAETAMREAGATRVEAVRRTTNA